MRKRIVFSFFLSLTLLGTLATSAQDSQAPKGAPLGVWGFLLFTAVADEAKTHPQAAINKIKEVSGVSEDVAHRFLEYIESAIEEADALWPVLAARTCERRHELLYLSDLDRALKAEDAAYEVGRAQIVRESASVVGSEGMRQLESWLTRKFSSRRFEENDYEVLLPRAKLSTQEFLDRKCNGDRPAPSYF